MVTAMSQVRIADLSGKDPVPQVLAQVFSLIGLPKSCIPTGKDADDLVRYVREQLGRFALMDIRIAFTLYIQSRLDEQPKKEHYDFSPYLMERVMQSYSRFRFSVLKSNMQDPDGGIPNISTEEIDRRARGYITAAFERVKRGEDVLDWGNYLYRWLDRKGLIPFTKEEKDAILEEARKKVDQQQLTGMKIPLGDNREVHVRNVAREIALTQYFQGLILNGTDISEELNKTMYVSDNADNSVPGTENTGEKADERDQNRPGGLPEKHPCEEEKAT